MNKDAFRLTSPSGTETELPVRSGTTGPDVIDVGKLTSEGYFTYDPGFVSTASCDSLITYNRQLLSLTLKQFFYLSCQYTKHQSTR